MPLTKEGLLFNGGIIDVDEMKQQSMNLGKDRIQCKACSTCNAMMTDAKCIFGASMMNI
jgi:hypothetical protein